MIWGPQPILNRSDVWEGAQPMEHWIWYFIIYSFLGFCLEVAFARVVRCPKQDRKCFLILPLCPVYGVGALLILAPMPILARWPAAVAVWSGIAATAAEYAVSVFYEKTLGVSFWDYSLFPWNLQGRVCLQFSFSWCVLGLVMVYLLQPAASLLAERLPSWALYGAVAALLLDGALTAVLLRRTGDTDTLKWYQRKRRGCKAEGENIA